MKTAVIYARYSSTNQTEQSIEGQVHVCQDFAKRNNIIIVDSYIDRAISGTTDERDSFQRMLKDSNNKKWNYVLVYKLDRFARNKYEEEAIFLCGDNYRKYLSQLFKNAKAPLQGLSFGNQLKFYKQNL